MNYEVFNLGLPGDTFIIDPALVFICIEFYGDRK